MDGSVVYVSWHQCASRLINSYLGRPESKSQTASRSVLPFLQGLLLWQTDHAPRSVTIGHIYIRSTAIQPNNTVSASQTLHKCSVTWSYMNEMCS